MAISSEIAELVSLQELRTHRAANRFSNARDAVTCEKHEEARLRIELKSAIRDFEEARIGRSLCPDWLRLAVTKLSLAEQALGLSGKRLRDAEQAQKSAHNVFFAELVRSTALESTRRELLRSELRKDEERTLARHVEMHSAMLMEVRVRK